jgi:hypothetical protein
MKPVWQVLVLVGCGFPVFPHFVLVFSFGS